MFKKYVLNFWIWWYGVQTRKVFTTIFSFWSLTLANLNVLPMLSNLFVPMYQDQSISGKVMSFFLRLIWGIGGSIIQLLITIPLVIVFFIWIILPFVVIYQIFRTLLL